MNDLSSVNLIILWF